MRAPASSPRNHTEALRVLAWPARRKRAENPYTYLVQLHTAPHGIETHELTALRLLRPGWDIIHIHWPEVLLTKPSLILQVLVGSSLLALLFLQRLFTRARLVWTVHNAQAHEVHHPRWGSLYMGLFVRLVDGIILLTEASRSEIIDRYPMLKSLPYTVARLGHYRHLNTGEVDRSAARAALGIGDHNFAFLYFGQIRPYKNVPGLVSCFRQLEGDRYRLIIAGATIDEAVGAELVRASQDDTRIMLDLRFVPEERLIEYVVAADCVVLPFSQILNSGSALFALSFERPVLTIATPSFAEVAALVGKKWLRTYEGSLTKEILADAARRHAPAEAPDLTEFEWEIVGGNTAEFFHRLATRAGGPGV